MEPLNILFRNEESKLMVLWSVQKGVDFGYVLLYGESYHSRVVEYRSTQMTKRKFSYGEHEQLAKGGMTRWDM